MKLSGGAPEGRLAVARASLEAREFARARDALEPLLQDRPSMRVCLLMSDLEQAEHGSTGKGREWLARATRAPRDPAWIADGIVSDHWLPISPVTGRLDAFVWQAPPDVLVAPELTLHDDVTADLDDERRPLPAMPAPVPAPEPEPEPVAPPEAPAEPEPDVLKSELMAALNAPEPVREETPLPPTGPVVFPATPPDVPKPKEEAAARRSVFSVR
jgi:HemY protein